MTRKDYEAIATRIAAATVVVREPHDNNRLGKDYLVENLANYMAQDNPRFDKDRFLAACYVDN